MPTVPRVLGRGSRVAAALLALAVVSVLSVRAAAGKVANQSPLRRFPFVDRAEEDARFAPVFFRGSSQVRWVALTFDVGGIANDKNPDIPYVLQTLRRAGAKATFFVTGRWAWEHPELLSAIAADGHQIENHGFTHRHFYGLSCEEIRDDIRRGAEAIESVVGKQTRFFRPPFGFYNPDVLNACRQAGQTAVMWDVAPVESRSATPLTALAHLALQVAPGSIILCHPEVESTRASLPYLLWGLKLARFRLVTIDELASSSRPVYYDTSQSFVAHDVGPSHWAYPHVQAVVRAGMMGVNLEGFFRPDQPMTRGEFAAAIVALADMPILRPTTPSFRDIRQSDWTYEAIETALHNRLLTGYQDQTFRPTRPITRAEACLAIFLALGLRVEPPGEIRYTDVPAADKSFPAIRALSALGVIEGFPDGTFRPADPITRAHAAVIFSRLLKMRATQ